jgi:3-oxoacyl-[acyl-carrier protein] reductase
MKKAIVTGFSRGIGMAIAENLSRKGFDVYKKRIEITNENEIIAAASEVGDSVDVLVNCAGISHVGLFQDMTNSEITHVLDVNLKGAMLLTKHILPHMISKKSGVIINISSVWGKVGASLEVAYSASKAGLIGFTKALAREVAPSNIRVNCICPEAVDTDMLKIYSEDELLDIAKNNAMGKLITPEQIAETCVYLIEQKYITGAIL